MKPVGAPKKDSQIATKPERGAARGSKGDFSIGRTSGSPVSSTNPTFTRSALLIAAALIAVTVFVYSPVWNNDFVNFDDPEYVTANPHVNSGLTIENVKWAFYNPGHGSNWHPVTSLSHMLDVELFGVNPRPSHLINLGLHLVNTLLLFWLLNWMTGAVGRSAFVAGLFAVHPLHVESVAWVAERKDVLSSLFWLLTMCAYGWYAQRPGKGRYVAVGVLFAMGLMSKPMVVTLPLVLLLADVWPLGRVPLTQGVGRTMASLRRMLWEKVPLLVLSLASSIITFAIQQHSGAVSALDSLGFGLRVQNALVSYVVYVGKMVWPAELAVFYPYPKTIPEEWVMGCALLLVGVTVAAVRAAARRPYVAVGWLWYLGTLVPVIGLVQVGGQAMADRYTYIPLIGLFIVIAWGAVDLLAAWNYRRVVLPMAAGVVIVVLAIAARGQLWYWKDSSTLLSRALQVTVGNYMAHNNFGTVLADQGKMDEAMKHFTEALQTKPTFPQAHNNLGSALAHKDRYEEAVVEYEAALRYKPNYPEAENNLAAALRNLGRTEEAIQHYEKALQLSANSAEAHNRLGAVLSELGKYPEAIAHFNSALRLKRDYVEAMNNLGLALANQGQFENAIEQYQAALRSDPDYVQAHYNLGLALASQERYDEAIAQYEKALRIRPELAEAENNMGVALANQGKVDEAIKHFSNALRLKPDYVDARNNLAFATASRGSE